MTIKTQNGKVITKDGKVSCESGADPECCMYPSQDFFDSINSATDLPDAVKVNGTSYSRNNTSYGDTQNGVALVENKWIRYLNGSQSSRNCLIQSGVEDEFADV